MSGGFSMWKPDEQTHKETNPKDNAATSRLDLSLVPSSAIAYMALALTEGHLKYGGYNWRKAGVQYSVYVAALQRHLFKWWNGEECDPDTNVPHLAYIAACIGILIDSTEQLNAVDDRPPSQNTNQLLLDFQKKVEQLQLNFPNPAKRITER